MKNFSNVFVATAIMLSTAGVMSANELQSQTYPLEANPIQTEQVLSNSVHVSQTDADHALAQKVLTEVNNDSLISKAAKSGIQVHAKGGVITINGTVPLASEKQLIETAAKKAAGVTIVENNITVTTK